MKSWTLLAVLLLVLPFSAEAGKKSSKNSSISWSVVVRGNKVNVLRNGKFYTQVRPKYPDVRGWKFQRDYSELVVKSGVSREPGLVELFDVQSGKLIAKIRANQVKDGRPAWAKNFAE